MNWMARIFARGFLLEALWNARGRQRGAVAWIFGRPLNGEPEEPFNANPTLAGYALGRLASEEEDTGTPGVMLTSAISGIGDRLVWGLLRPLAVVFSLLATWLGAIPAAAVLLLVYNPAELALRRRAIRHGLEGSAAILHDLGKSGLSLLACRLARIGAGVVGFLCGFWFFGEILAGRILEAVAVVLGTAVAWALLGRRLGTWSRPLAALLFALIWIGFELLVRGR